MTLWLVRVCEGVCGEREGGEGGEGREGCVLLKVATTTKVDRERGEVGAGAMDFGDLEAPLLLVMRRRRCWRVGGSQGRERDWSRETKVPESIDANRWDMGSEKESSLAKTRPSMSMLVRLERQGRSRHLLGLL